jgi:hypothetical protein
MYQATVVQDSIAPHGVRLVTLQLQYPRFIHAELMTHRVFSRNASSSRAIPVKKLVDLTVQHPARFVHIGKNQGGMQAKEEVDEATRATFEAEWMALMRINAAYALRWAEQYNIHKQIANRVMEPWAHISVVVTATEWDNFFELRDHPDAQPEFRNLVHHYIRPALAESVPAFRPRDQEHHSAWHLPYVTETERNIVGDPKMLAKLSAARCARVSYLNHDGSQPNMEADLKLYEQLVGSRPLHASPVEHQAYPLPTAHGRSRNFRGWYQHRASVDREAL